MTDQEQPTLTIAEAQRVADELEYGRVPGIDEMRDVARALLASQTALRKIAYEMGRVCEDFETCGHASCADSCGAVLVALDALL